MRILFTGMQNRQCTEDYGKLTRDYTPTEKYLLIALRMLGHEVDVRKVPWKEQGLRERYDMAMVGLGPYCAPSSFGIRFQALWVASQLPHVTFVGDWQIALMTQSFKMGTDALFSAHHFPGERTYFTDAMNTRELYEVTRLWQNMPAIMLPMHGWGDPATYKIKHKRSGTPYAFDPTPIMVQDFGMDTPTLRQRDTSWLYFTLQKGYTFLEKKDLQWPVEGCWDTSTQPYWSEESMLERMRTAGGVLCPPRHKANRMPGLFRNRNVHHASRLVPVAADSGEMNPDSDCWPEPRDIENMDEAGRFQLALAQRDALMRATGSVSDSLGQLDCALKSAVIHV